MGSLGDHALVEKFSELYATTSRARFSKFLWQVQLVANGGNLFFSGKEVAAHAAPHERDARVKLFHYPLTVDVFIVKRAGRANKNARAASDALIGLFAEGRGNNALSAAILETDGALANHLRAHANA